MAALSAILISVAGNSVEYILHIQQRVCCHLCRRPNISFYPLVEDRSSMLQVYQ